MKVARLTQRKLRRAVAWEPTHEMYFRVADMLRTSQTVPPLYIEQDALRTIEARLRDGDVPLPFGLLIGNRYFCPRAASEYLLIEEVMSAHIEPSAKSPTEALMRELRDVAAIAESRGRLPIGWYIGGADVLEPIAREDVTLHKAIFPEPWQVMLVRDSVEGEVHGAFVRIEPSDQRAYAIRFFEMLPDSALFHKGAAQTVVRWKNYSTEASVGNAEEGVIQKDAPVPKAGILQRLSGLRKRLGAPRPSDATPNGVTPRKPATSPPAVDIATRAPSRAAPTWRPPILSSPEVPEATDVGASPAKVPASEMSKLQSPSSSETPPMAANAPGSITKSIDVVTRPAPSTPTSDHPKFDLADKHGARVTQHDPDRHEAAVPNSEPEASLNSAVSSQSAEKSQQTTRPLSAAPAAMRLDAGRRSMEQGGSIQLAPTVVDVSGKVLPDIPIRFASNNHEIVKVSRTGLARSMGPAGSVIVTVRAGGLQQLVPIDVVAVGKSLEVQPSAVQILQGGTSQLEATLRDAIGMPVSGPAITYESSNPSIVRVSAHGQLTSIGPAGAASITVQSGAVSIVVHVTIIQVATRIEVSPNPAEVAVGRRRRLTGRVFDAVDVPMKGRTLEFSSNDPAIIAVSSDGILSAVSEHGETMITVRVSETPLSTEVPASVAVAQPRWGRIAADISIPGAYCAVIVSADEAYVAPLGAPVVRVDLATNVVSPIPGSEGGLGIAFCQARGEVYAAAYMTNTIDIISVLKRSLIATLDVPDQVLDIVVSRDAGFAYLGLKGGIAVVDLQTRGVAMIDRSVFGLHLALHPSRPLLYVSGDAPEVNEIDLGTGRLVRSFALTAPAFGQGLAVAPDGASLYVANERAGCIDVFDLSTGRHASTLRLPWRGVWGLALAPDGTRLFASGQEAGGLVSIDCSTGHVLKTYNSSGGYRLALSPDGLTLLAAGARNGLLVVR